jgi:hypothetical protein
LYIIDFHTDIGNSSNIDNSNKTKINLKKYFFFKANKKIFIKKKENTKLIFEQIAVNNNIFIKKKTFIVSLEFFICLKIYKKANEIKINETEKNWCLDELSKNINTGTESINNITKNVKLEANRNFLQKLKIILIIEIKPKKLINEVN